MILKQERIIPEIRRKAPEIGKPYTQPSVDKPSKFYEYDGELNSAVAGYQPGPQNSYLEYLFYLGDTSEDYPMSYEEFLSNNKENIKLKRTRK